MGYFDKTIEFIRNTPIEELTEKMKEYGIKFVENKDDVIFLYQEYVNENDEYLSKDAIELKNKLIAIENDLDR
jgi:hypothetical protein